MRCLQKKKKNTPPFALPCEINHGVELVDMSTIIITNYLIILYYIGGLISTFVSTGMSTFVSTGVYFPICAGVLSLDNLDNLMLHCNEWQKEILSRRLSELKTGNWKVTRLSGVFPGLAYP